MSLIRSPVTFGRHFLTGTLEVGALYVVCSTKSVVQSLYFHPCITHALQPRDLSEAEKLGSWIKTLSLSVNSHGWSSYSLVLDESDRLDKRARPIIARTSFRNAFLCRISSRLISFHISLSLALHIFFHISFHIAHHRRSSRPSSIFSISRPLSFRPFICMLSHRPHNELRTLFVHMIVPTCYHVEPLWIVPDLDSPMAAHNAHCGLLHSCAATLQFRSQKIIICDADLFSFYSLPIVI